MAWGAAAPASRVQHTPALRAMTEPTEMSVPAEAETTRVMPMARMATSLPRFRMFTRRPLSSSFWIPILKNS